MPSAKAAAKAAGRCLRRGDSELVETNEVEVGAHLDDALVDRDEIGPDRSTGEPAGAGGHQPAVRCPRDRPGAGGRELVGAGAGVEVEDVGFQLLLARTQYRRGGEDQVVAAGVEDQ